jgi:hypothetical protein
MAARPRRRKLYPPENQWYTDAWWQMARQRPLQHVYRMMYRGQHVGYLLHEADGWYWRYLFPKQRISARAYPTWEQAAAALARSAAGRTIAGATAAKAGPGEWKSALVRGTPWVPKPAKAEPAKDGEGQG